VRAGSGTGGGERDVEIQTRRAVSRMRVLRDSISGPGISCSSCRPPTRSAEGRRASTMIPIPPTHCVSCRQIAMLRALLDVGGDAPTRRAEAGHPFEDASSGRPSWGRLRGCRAARRGAAAASQVSATTRNPLARPAPVAASRSGDHEAGRADDCPAARNGQNGSP
jgi:hypothetical protein